MNHLRILLSVLLISLPLFLTSGVLADNSKANDHYDAELAKSLGADDYGMRSYVFVTLLSGETVIEDEASRREIFAGHFSNMSRLAEEGILVLAGPLIDAPPKRGIFVFNVASIEEAENIVKTDPAVAVGVFDYELVKFYSSAALLKINDIHQSIQKTAIE